MRLDLTKRLDVALVLSAYKAMGSLSKAAYALGVSKSTFHEMLVEIRQTWSPL